MAHNMTANRYDLQDGSQRDDRQNKGRLGAFKNVAAIVRNEKDIYIEASDTMCSQRMLDFWIGEACGHKTGEGLLYDLGPRSKASFL